MHHLHASLNNHQVLGMHRGVKPIPQHFERLVMVNDGSHVHIDVEPINILWKADFMRRVIR